MLFALGREADDPEAGTRRKLWTAKCRIDEEPEPWSMRSPGSLPSNRLSPTGVEPKRAPSQPPLEDSAPED